MNKAAATLLIVLAILGSAGAIEMWCDRYRPRTASWLRLIVILVLTFAIAIALVRVTHAHDHDRPDLDGWFVTLKSKKGYCCDGKDQLHLRDIDWVTQDKPLSHYRVKIPLDQSAFEAARRGEAVDTMWIDVPDDAVLDEPNKAGTALVWPLYGYGGASIRCFMPGEMS